MGDVSAAVAEAKRSVAGATAAIAATEHPSPVSRIPVRAGVTRTFSAKKGTGYFVWSTDRLKVIGPWHDSNSTREQRR